TFSLFPSCPSLLSTLFFFFFYVSASHLYLHSFPTRRSSDLNSRVFQNIPNKFPENSWEHFSNPYIPVCSHVHRVTRHSMETKTRSEEHTSELQSRFDLVCRLLLEKKNTKKATERAQKSSTDT